MKNELGKVRKGGRPKNEDVRFREYLTDSEVYQMIAAIRRVGRNRTRNAALIELMYRHGLRVTEAINLKWDHVSLSQAIMRIRRLKGGEDSLHPLSKEEIKLLRNLQSKCPGPWLFQAEGGGPLDRRSAFQIVAKAGLHAQIGFPVHPHMLRHARGYKLINNDYDIRKIAGYLGHKSLSSTMRYTALNHTAFDGMSS